MCVGEEGAFWTTLIDLDEHYVNIPTYPIRHAKHGRHDERTS